MGKKNKKRSNNKKGGGNNNSKPNSTSTTTSPRNLNSDVAAAAASACSDNSNPPIPLSSPEKAVAAAAPAPAAAAAAAATATAAAAELPVLVSDEEEAVAANAAEEAFKDTCSAGGAYTGATVVVVVSDDDGGGETLIKVVDEMIPTNDDEKDDVTQVTQSSTGNKDNNTDTAPGGDDATVVDEETAVVKEDAESAAAATSKENSSHEKPAAVVLPVVVLGDHTLNNNDDDKEATVAAVVVVVAPKEEDEKVAAAAAAAAETAVQAEEEEVVVTITTTAAPTFVATVVVEEEAANNLVQDLDATLAVEEEKTAPTVAEEAVAAASLVDSFQEQAAVATEAMKDATSLALQETVQKAAPTEQEAVKDSVPAATKLTDEKGTMDATVAPVAKMELNVVTSTNASSSSSSSSSSNDAIISSPAAPAPRADINYKSMIETPSPSKVADLKSKLWDSKGLQVRIRPSVTAADSLRKQQALAPVPSPFRPKNAAPGVNAEKAATDAAVATTTAADDKDSTTSAPPTVGQSPKEAAASPAPLSSNDDTSPATSTSATGLSANNNGRRLARRKGPTAPRSILDEHALLAALQESGVAIKDIHISAFYQALHRQQYPDLPTFVENFYKHENNNKHELLLSPTLTGPSVAQTAVSQFSKKNRNKMQLPKAFLEFLSDPQNGFVTITSKIAEAQTSLDKSTTKLRIELHDGKMVESVLMRYNKNSKENHRASLCISSQCGCAMGCTFCATGMMGLSGNLTTTEILEQIIHADGILAREWAEKEQQQQHGKQQQQQAQEQHQQQSSDLRTKNQTQKKPTLDAVRNVVFMGMGEPLDNYTNVVEACRALMDRKRWNLAHGRVTVSTVGLASQMRKLSQDLPHVNLALSLHAPNQEMRTKIVPSAKRYPIEELVDALDGHMKAYLNSPERVLHVNRQKLGVKNEVDDDDGDNDDMSQDDDAPDSTNGCSNCNSKESGNTRRRAMIEYIMLEGETCTETSAHELGKLCQGKSFVVNLIPYNATNVKDPLKCPTYDEMQKFRAIVTSYGVFCTVRRTMGSDIDSACGQLITLQQQQQRQQQQQHDQGPAATGSVGDIEDSSRSCQPRSPKDAATSISQKTTTTTAKANASNTDDSNNNKDDLDKYIGPLAIAAGVVAACFLASIFLRPRRR